MSCFSRSRFWDSCVAVTLTCTLTSGNGQNQPLQCTVPQSCPIVGCGSCSVGVGTVVLHGSVSYSLQSNLHGTVRQPFAVRQLLQQVRFWDSCCSHTQLHTQPLQCTVPRSCSIVFAWLSTTSSEPVAVDVSGLVTRSCHSATTNLAACSPKVLQFDSSQVDPTY